MGRGTGQGESLRTIGYPSTNPTAPFTLWGTLPPEEAPSDPLANLIEQYSLDFMDTPEKRQALVDYLNDLYEHDPQYQKQHLIDMQIALALLQLYDGPIHQLSDTNIYNEEFLIALVKFKAVYNEGGYHRLKLDQEEPYRYELNGFIAPDMVRYARAQGDQDYEQLFQILYGDEDFQTHVLQIYEESTSEEHLLKMKAILQEFGFYHGDTSSPVYDLAFLLALMKFKQYANQHDPHLLWAISGHITEEHILWSEQHRQWLQGPVIFPVMKSIFMSMAGFVAGMLEASVRIMEGIAYAFWHPIKTLQGISYAIWHWDQVAKHLWTEITTAYIEMVLYGNDFSARKFYGEMTVEVLASVFTLSKAKQVAGVGHASKLLPSTVLGGKVAQGSGFLSLGSLTGFIGNISSRAKTFFNQLREGLKRHGDEVVGGGNEVLRLPITKFTTKKLQHEFKHARDFGVSGNWNKGAAEVYQKAIQNHIDSATDVYKSTYRGQEVYVYLNKNTGVGVYTDMSGNYVGGWKFSTAQMNFHLSNGTKLK